MIAERLGFVGLGRMGRAIVPRLVAAGAQVTVWNRSPGRAAGLGAAEAPDLAGLAAASDVILTMLTDDEAVEAIYGALLAAQLGGKLCIEMSTIRLDTIRALAPRLAAAGARLVDCPVAGTVGPAREGKLLALAGGDAADLERARPVLEAFSRRIAHCGPSGSGTLMKLVLNFPMAVYFQALGEALAMGSAGGLEVDAMLDLFLDSAGAIRALEAKAPVIRGATAEVAFDLTGVRKDLVAMTATGTRLGVPMPAGAAALSGFAAATAAGAGSKDLATIVPWWIEMAKRSRGTDQ